MNIEQKYAGRSALLLARASTPQQTVSVEDQIDNMNRFAEKQGIVVAGIVGNAGISGSMPWDRRDFDEVVIRKKTLDDFDILIVYDIHRFSRAGSRVGSVEHNRLLENGIDLLFSADINLEGDAGEVHMQQDLAHSKSHAKKISLYTTRGRLTALHTGRSLPSSQTPFGTDRFYRTNGCAPLHVVRYERDGSQTVYDANDRDKIVRRYEPYDSDPKGNKVRYIKAKTDLVELCPGREKDRQTIIGILRRWHVDGWRARRIAKELNELGIPSPRNLAWSLTQVARIIAQPAYYGYVLANRSSGAIYYRTGTEDPIEVIKNAIERSGTQKPSITIRPTEDWVRIEQPMMVEFVPEDIREPARLEAERMMAQRATNAQKPKGQKEGKSKNKHKHSPYLLTGLLREATTGLSMVGCNPPPPPRIQK